MSESKLIDNPLENIATLVQKQFRQQSARVASKAKHHCLTLLCPLFQKTTAWQASGDQKLTPKL
jgi:hypothetical protein